MVFSLRDDKPLLVAFFLVIGVGAGMTEAWLITHIARVIEISPDAIEGRPYLGRRRRIPWADIASLEAFQALTLDGPATMTIGRVVSRHGPSIAFTSKMAHVDDLLTVLRDRLDIRPVEPVWWKRMIFRGYP
jgi:hypothetical protein